MHEWYAIFDNPRTSLGTGQFTQYFISKAHKSKLKMVRNLELKRVPWAFNCACILR